MDKIWEHHPDLQPNDLKEHGREITKYANAAYSDLYADCPRASHDDGVDVSGHSHNETSLSS
jgi:curved DNA-binding protein CbpA